MAVMHSMRMNCVNHFFNIWLQQNMHFASRWCFAWSKSCFWPGRSGFWSSPTAAINSDTWESSNLKFIGLQHTFTKMIRSIVPRLVSRLVYLSRFCICSMFLCFDDWDSPSVIKLAILETTRIFMWTLWVPVPLQHTFLNFLFFKKFGKRRKKSEKVQAHFLKLFFSLIFNVIDFLAVSSSEGSSHHTFRPF